MSFLDSLLDFSFLDVSPTALLSSSATYLLMDLTSVPLTFIIGPLGLFLTFYDNLRVRVSLWTQDTTATHLDRVQDVQRQVRSG